MTAHSSPEERKVPGDQGGQAEASEGGYLSRTFGLGVGSGLRFSVLFAFLGFAALIAADSTLFALLYSEPTAAPMLVGIAAVALIPAALVAAYVLVSDPGDSIPVSVLAAGFFLGMVATFFAAALNGVAAERFESLPVYALPVFFYLFVGPVEEGLKVLAISVHPTGNRRLKTALEYAVVGAFVGLGFAFVENAVYLVSDVVLIDSNTAVTETAVTRASVSPLHVILTAVAGYYVGKARLSSGGYGGKVLTAAKGLLAVAFLHGTYNTMVSQLTAAGNLPAQGSVGAGVVDGQAATPVFIVVFFIVILYLLERLIREGRREYTTKE